MVVRHIKITHSRRGYVGSLRFFRLYFFPTGTDKLANENERSHHRRGDDEDIAASIIRLVPSFLLPLSRETPLSGQFCGMWYA